MALIVNGQDIPNGTVWTINGVQVNSVECNGIAIWGSTEAPGVVDDFQASDDEYGQITMTWTRTTGLPAPHYDLFLDGVKIAEDINPGYVFLTQPGTYTFYIQAYNSVGRTTSNYDNGTALIPPSGNVTITYDSVSGGNPETVSGSGTSFTFTPPQGITEVDVCMVGGGGGGAVPVYGSTIRMASGGYSGQVVSNTINVSSSVPITLGSRGSGGVTASPWEGGKGGTTSFGSLKATGGSGGAHSTQNNYGGNGGSRTTCLGTSNDGVVHLYGLYYVGMGGQTSGYSKGGAGYTASDGYIHGGDASHGSGGGGAGCILGGTEVGGLGGYGVVKLSW